MAQIPRVVAVAQAGGCSSDLTPSLKISICRRYSPKKTKVGGGTSKEVKEGECSGNGGGVSSSSDPGPKDRVDEGI